MKFQQWKQEYEHATNQFWAVNKSFDYNLVHPPFTEKRMYIAMVRLNENGFSLGVRSPSFGHVGDFGEVPLDVMRNLMNLHFIMTRYVRGEIDAFPTPEEWNASLS